MHTVARNQERRAPIRTAAAWRRWGWIVESVASRHGLTSNALLGSSHRGIAVRARRDLYACLFGSGLSYSDVARLLGRDHTTVIAGIRKELAS